MKKTILLTIFLAPCVLSLAQTNTFPTTGNVGIGTTTPADQLEIIQGTRKVGFNTAIGGSTGGILSLSRGDDGTKVLFLGTSGAPSDDHVIYGFGGGTEMRFVSAGGTSAGFGFYTNISSTTAFSGTRPTTPVLKIDGAGYTGIGTNVPLSKLHINSAVERESLRLYKSGNTTNYLNIWQGVAGSAIDPIGTGVLYLGYDQPTNVYMGLTTGKIGIGTTMPDQKLTVKGKIHAEEVVIDLNVPGPDYVFETSYKLPTLEELNSYIKVNKHLPEVPNACTLEENGISLGAMNMILLKKVEELTLYSINQNEEIKLLIEQNRLLEERLKKLESK